MRVRSQLFMFVERDTVKRVRLSSSSSLYVAHVSPGARRPDACRSIGFDRKGGTLLYWREGNANATLCRCACRFRCHIPSLGKQEGYTSIIEEFESLQVVWDARQRSTRIFIVMGSPRNAREPWIHFSFLHRLSSCEVLTGSTARRCESIAPLR